MTFNRYLVLLLILPIAASGAEHRLSGIVDIRYSYSETLDSYSNGGLGKFAQNDGTQLQLAQLGLGYQLSFLDNWSIHLQGIGAIDGVNDGAGVTEAFLQYKGLPSETGFRHAFRVGSFYPAISIENTAIGWSNPYSLNNSMINTWVGEELRLTGLEYKGRRLGKFVQSNIDIGWNASLFYNNDPAGAMLAWHGWTQSSRQTPLHERLKLPDFPARDGMLAGQAAESNPFIDLDGIPGYLLSADAKFGRNRLLQLGIYDNRAIPYIVKNGQYGWRTKFIFAGLRWQLTPSTLFFAQAMQGSTLMQSPQRVDVVHNDYRSGYLALQWQRHKHQLTGRIESFSINDLDLTVGDDNNETGKALTLGYRYRLKKGLYLQAETSWVHSKRAARDYQLAPVKLTEQQIQFGLRYYFN